MKAKKETGTGRSPRGIMLTDEARQALSRLSRKRSKAGKKAKAIILIADGAIQADAAQRTGLSVWQVRYLVARFRQAGLRILPEAELIDSSGIGERSKSTASRKRPARKKPAKKDPPQEKEAETREQPAQGAIGDGYTEEVQEDTGKKKVKGKKKKDVKKKDKGKKTSKGKKKDKDKDKDKDKKKKKKKKGKKKTSIKSKGKDRQKKKSGKDNRKKKKSGKKK